MPFHEPRFKGLVDLMKRRIEPSFRALWAFLSAVMLISGLLMRKLTIAWLGLVILLVFSMLFLFGVGGGLLSIAGLLLILLSIVTVLRRNMLSHLQ